MFERVSLYDLHEWFSGNHPSLLLGSPERRLQEIKDWCTEGIFLDFSVLSMGRSFLNIRFDSCVSRILCSEKTNLLLRKQGWTIYATKNISELQKKQQK